MWRDRLYQSVSVLITIYFRKMSDLDSLKCHALTQGCVIDWLNDYTIETFISAHHPA